jgi:hypothetical protein
MKLGCWIPPLKLEYVTLPVHATENSCLGVSAFIVNVEIT